MMYMNQLHIYAMYSVHYNYYYNITIIILFYIYIYIVLYKYVHAITIKARQQYNSTCLEMLHAKIM